MVGFAGVGVVVLLVLIVQSVLAMATVGVSDGDEAAIMVNKRPQCANKGSSRLTDANNVAEVELPAHRRALSQPTKHR